jgi:hypothetical protein
MVHDTVVTQTHEARREREAPAAVAEAESTVVADQGGGQPAEHGVLSAVRMETSTRFANRCWCPAHGDLLLQSRVAAGALRMETQLVPCASNRGITSSRSWCPAHGDLHALRASLMQHYAEYGGWARV